MTTLSQRDWSITLGVAGSETAVRIGPGAPGRSLTCQFEVSKTTDREPNKASLKIYNLTRRRTDALMELPEAPQLQIVAGFAGLTDTIFTGDCRDIGAYKDGPDIITEMEAEDGGRAYRTGTINQAFGAGTPVATVIRACAEAMGVGLGNTNSVAATAELDSGGNNYATGVVLHGPAWRELNRVCTSCSLRWSVQNGVLQLRGARRAAVVRAIRLSPSTGLLESPTRGRRDERTGVVTYGAKALMIPGLYPGRVVRLESRIVEANLMISKARYVGDTTGDDWLVDLQLQEYES